ncbi:MAG: Fic family protein [Candidatus Moraniibacteriota bacterium]
MAKRVGETSYKETAFGIIPRSKLIPLEIEGIRRAWDFVVKKDEQGTLPLTSRFMRELHRVGFGWILPDMGGKYRTVDVTVSQHVPPKFFQVPQLMEEFSKDLRMRMKHLPSIEQVTFLVEVVSLLAWAHHRFLWIHPFTDYNGRIGRLLNNIILLRLGLPPIELKVETPTGRKRYIDALRNADHHSYTKLEKIIESAIEESIREIGGASEDVHGDKRK